MTVAREAIQAFYRQENLPAHGNVNVWVDWVTAFGIKFPFPNILGRNKVLPYHDLHHIVTGYRTDEAGEFEVGAWCLATGKNPSSPISTMSQLPSWGSFDFENGLLPHGNEGETVKLYTNTL